jgi:hypothetical protein
MIAGLGREQFLSRRPKAAVLKAEVPLGVFRGRAVENPARKKPRAGTPGAKLIGIT